jgi:hypothetical protein
VLARCSKSSKIGRDAQVRTVAEDETPTPANDDGDECLHCAIIEMVEERIEAGGAARRIEILRAIRGNMPAPDPPT